MSKRCQHCNKELNEMLMKCCPDCLLEKTRERERETIRSKKIAQKLTVTMTEIESAIYAGRNWDDGKFYDKDGIKAVTELFESKGFEVISK